MKVLMNTGGIAATNSFLVADEQARQAVLFDAPNDTTDPLLDEAQKQGWDVLGLWLTHGHFDHMADHPVVKSRFPRARLLVHRLDAAKLAHPTSMFSLPIHIEPATPDELVEDGQTLRIGSIEVHIIHTPGHAEGHVCYHMPAEKALVGGDLIIGGSIGRTDLPDSSNQQMRQSLRRILQLPRDTRLLPGHGEPATLGEELRTNLYLADALAEDEGTA